jgi:predicted Zn-dependent protease
MLGESQCLDLVNAALSACECDQAEVIVHHTSSSLTRFAESSIHQNVAEANGLISVRAITGKRLGCARTNQLTADEARFTARRALDLARVAAEDQDFVSLPGPQPIPSVSGFAGATAASTPESRASAARAIADIAARSGCVASGSIAAEALELAIGNSLGVRAYAPLSQASTVLVVTDDESSGYADWRGIDISKLDAALLAETATHKCVDGRSAEAVSPGDYTVILEPAAVGELVMFLGYLGLARSRSRKAAAFSPAASARSSWATTSPSGMMPPIPAAWPHRSIGRVSPSERSRSSRTASPAMSCTTRIPRTRRASRTPATPSPRPTQAGRFRSTCSSHPATPRRMR